MRISDWSSDVCSSDLAVPPRKRSDAAVSGLVDGRDRKRRAVRMTRIARARVNDANITRVSRPPNVRIVNIRAGVKFGFEVGNCHSRSEEHTSELQSLMCISYAVFCLKKKTNTIRRHTYNNKTTH